LQGSSSQTLRVAERMSAADGSTQLSKHNITLSGVQLSLSSYPHTHSWLYLCTFNLFNYCCLLLTLAVHKRTVRCIPCISLQCKIVQKVALLFTFLTQFFFFNGTIRSTVILTQPFKWTEKYAEYWINLHHNLILITFLNLATIQDWHRSIS
jgi:hypothetical protein